MMSIFRTPVLKKGISCLLALMLAFGIIIPNTLLSRSAAADTGDLVTEQPVLVVTGTDIISGGVYTESNISFERSYTLAELQAFGEDVVAERLYSANANGNNRRIYRGIGVDLTEILNLSGHNGSGDIKSVSGADGRTSTFGLDDTRYYYPNFVDNGEKISVSAMLAWRNTRDGGTYSADAGLFPPIPETFTEQQKYEADSNSLQLLYGQTIPDEIITGGFNSGVNKLEAGSTIPDTLITINGAGFTRAELLLMPRAEHEYTYSASGGSKTDTARGVPLAVLLEDLNDTDIIEFHAADDYAVGMTGMTKADLIAQNALLAYEIWDLDAAAWQGTFATAKNDASIKGYFTLYADGMSPGKMIDAISKKAPSNSAYKHINAGAPYNIDAITGATLTVEGPGVEASVPITVRELEETGDGNIYKGVYADVRESVVTTRIYEGIKVLSILDGLVNENVKPLDDTVVVVFKNRWRQDVKRLDYADIKNATEPVILAYGTSDTSETNIRPFVFNMGAGEDSALGNGDGPLKLVYDQSGALSDQFLSIAYMYIEEGTPPPGFKHITATNEAYNNVVNTEYILTFTGGALGREVNYTVSELEKMAEDEQTLSHRDSYSLSNTTYWYVNEYEGIKLWDLLVKMGVPVSSANYDSTLVSFSAWDNYGINTQFSFEQLADPNQFYFYEKSPLDIGTDRPTKAQLATVEYQPGNQGDQGAGDDWTVDGNSYPIKKGYPVLLAYGVNSYPYVRNAGMEGYKSGLGNSGGPMRLIYGKADGLNRSDPGAEENYAYFFNNGSNQLQRVQEIYVGDNTRYSTHLENPDAAYQDMKDSPDALTVEIITDEGSQTHTFTLAELESILYGAGVSKSDRDTQGRQEKGYYAYGTYNGEVYEDLYEGINLEYLLTEHIGLQGIIGAVELYSSEDAAPAAIYDLSTIGQRGYNSLRGTSGLGMMVAFAKNGYPMVEATSSPGYVGSDPFTGKTVQNRRGPLMFLRGQTETERDAGAVTESGDLRASVNFLTKIVVNLEADPYAHIGAEYEDLAKQEIAFSGAVAKEGGITLTVGALETKQRYIVDGEYTVGGQIGFYRGLDLYRLLNDREIGASPLMNEIVVQNGAGDSITLTYEDLTASGKTIILAYGSGAAGEEKPLNAADGGPIRLIIDGADESECITNVSEIEISAAEISAWKHNFGVYTQYADYTLEITGQNLINNKTYTVAELEAMDNIIVQDTYKIGNDVVAQGLDLYKLLQNIGFAQGMDSSVFTVYASDGYSPGQFNASQLKDGINGKPVLIAFGQGTTATNGLPLVPYSNLPPAGQTTSPGYDSIAGNDGGPLRFMVHDNSGWAVKFLDRIVVGAAGGVPEPVTEKDFNIYGLKNGTIGYDIKDLKNLPDGMGTKIETYTYTSGGSVTDTVKGAYLYDLLKAGGVSDSATVTVNTTDSYENSQADYRDIPMKDVKDQKYFVAYDAGSDVGNLSAVSDVDKQSPPVTATVRIYRNYNDGSNWRNRLTNIKGVTVADYNFALYTGGANGLPQASVRAIAADEAGGLWVGTNGAGLAYISPTGGITMYTTTTTPALKTDFVTGVAIAPDGTVWLTQGGSVGSINAPSTEHYGFASFKNGSFTFYDVDSPGSTLPNNCVYGIDVDTDGNIWLTTQYTTYNAEGGLTKFNPTTGVWQTWKMSNGLPTVSAWAVKGDGNGGAWVTTYRTSMTTLTWPDESYAHVNAAGAVTAYEIPGGKDLTWSRSIAIDQGGGVYITRMSGAHDPSNDGGWLDYIAPDGTVTAYKGDDLIPDLKAKSKAGFYPEIRTVFVDVAGGLWLTTNGLGVYRCTVTDGDITVVENYSSENGSWPAGSFDDVWSINVTPDGLAIFGSNGGLAMKLFDLAPPKESGFVTSQPVLVVTGQDIIGSGDYTSSNISNERSYSLADLQAMTNLTGTRLYSSLNSAGTKRIYIGEGTDVAGLLALSGYATDSGGNLTFIASDSYPASFNSTIPLNEGRLYYPKLGASADEETNPENVKALLVWKNDYITANGSDAPQLPAAETSLLLLVGQTSIDNVNNSLYNKSVQTVQAGQSMTTPVLEVGNSSYNRAQLLLMRRSTKDYTYSSSGGERTDTARGVALADLMSGLSNNTLVTFNAADGYDVSSYSMTLGELIAKDAILAYELLDGNNWQGVFATDRNDPEIQGYLRLYVDGMRPAQMIDRITFTETGIQQPDPPENLAGQKPEAAGQMGKIINTTTGMEYSDTQQTVWLPCSDGNTAVAPGQYYVRFKATNTQNASNAAFVSVPVFSGPGGGDPPPITGDAVLAVYNGSTLAKEFTQEEINNLPKITNNYSAYNNYPTYRTYTDVSGVEVMSLLSAAGLSPVGSREIIFYAYDGYSATLMADDLSASRYYFDSSGSRGGAVPAVIEFNENGGRLYLGQLAAQEQTLPSFVEKIDRIVVGGSADSWGAPTADPATSVRVKEGDPVRLALPDGSGNAAKIYYTLDGSTPTRESKIYNVIGAGWLDQQGKSENDPIIALSGTFTITARIIGLGKNDGPVTTFTYNSTGGGGGGGGGGTTTSNTGATVYEVDASKLGGAPVVTFETEDLSETIKKAVSSDSNGVLELRVNASDSAASVEAQLTAQTIKEMIDAGLKTLTVSNPLGSNSYDLAALQSIYTQGGDSGQISFLISKIDPASLDEDMQAIVGDNPLYRIEVLYNGIPIPSFGAGQATTQLNYTLKPGQSAYGLKVWHISDGGALTEIPCEYNSAGGYLEFTRNSHSYYMIAYDAVAANWTANPFADVKDGDWFYDSVRFVYEQGLMTGTSTDPMLFSPNIPLTRAMIVSILYRQSNAQIQSPALQATQGFNDVAAGLWYSEAVAWAAANGVVSGYGDGRFGPGDNITREQLAVILNNYQSISGRIPAAIQEEKVFADRERISDWATDAVRKLTMQGLISGKPGDIFDPKGNATRAETASILERFLKNTAE